MSYESISLVFVIVSVLPVTFRASAERDRLGKNNRTYSVFEMKQFTSHFLLLLLFTLLQLFLLIGPYIYLDFSLGFEYPPKKP